MLLVAAILVPPIMPLVWFILELGDGVSVELLGLLCLQPTSAHAARTVITDRGILNFISEYFVFTAHVYCRQREGKSVRQPFSLMKLRHDPGLRYGV
jgi:hypothetical protein